MWGICKSGYLYYSTVDQTTPPEYNIDDYILEVIVDCERRIVKKMCVFRIVTPEKKITWVAYGPDTENLSIYSRKPKNL